jgi:3-phosphoshikimate 1-carboxyvinyltransferase
MIIVPPQTRPLAGTLSVPGDKSITHRALFFGALNRGQTIIRHPSSALDCHRTFCLLTSLGYSVRANRGNWEVVGAARREIPASLTFHCGNSGTTARLAIGFLAGEQGSFTLVGDESLMQRPMGHVVKPLQQIGATIDTTNGRLPVQVWSNGELDGGASHGVVTVASAQAHAALVLAALRSRGGAMICRTRPMRDHTLRMMQLFGISLRRETSGLGVDAVLPFVPHGDRQIEVPGDISSAAFLIVAALLVPGSRVRIEGVGLNPTRIAFLHALLAMGASIRWNVGDDHFEPRGTIDAEYSPELEAIAVGPDNPGFPVAEMIDELPLLALVASQAWGRTVVRGAGDLRVKESDRISATLALLAALGIEAEELEDGFAVEGKQEVRGGCVLDARGDHRLCMMAAIAALIAWRETAIADPNAASVSYPQFWSDIERLIGRNLDHSQQL